MGRGSFTCCKVSPFTILIDSGGLSLGLEGERNRLTSDQEAHTSAHIFVGHFRLIWHECMTVLPITVTVGGEGGQGGPLARPKVCVQPV